GNRAKGSFARFPLCLCAFVSLCFLTSNSFKPSRTKLLPQRCRLLVSRGQAENSVQVIPRRHALSALDINASQLQMSHHAFRIQLKNLVKMRNRELVRIFL